MSKVLDTRLFQGATEKEKQNGPKSVLLPGVQNTSDKVTQLLGGSQIEIPKQTGTGGYYSRPDGKKTEQALEGVKKAGSAIIQPKTVLEKAESYLKQTQTQLDTALGSVETARSAFLKNPSAETLSALSNANRVCSSVTSRYNNAYAVYENAYNTYKPYEDSYLQAVSVYETEKSAEDQAVAKWRTTIRDSATVRREISSLDAQIQAVKKNTVQFSDDRDGSALGNTQAYLRQQEELRQLQEKRDLLQEELDWGTYYTFEEYRKAGDFGEKSKYTTAGTQGKDAIYQYLNNRDGYRDRFNRLYQQTQTGNQYASVESDFQRLGYDYIEDDEVAMYNYLYATGGQEKAGEYLASLNLTGRRNAQLKTDVGKLAETAPVTASALSVMMAPAKGLSYVGQVADYLIDGKIDQNAAYNDYSVVPGAIRDTVSKTIEESGKWGKVGSFAYQTGMSMGDFLMTGAVSGGSQAVSLAIMGTGAAADGTISAKDRGLSDNQAFALGTIQGLAEVVTEKVSIDALLKATGMGKSAVGYVLQNILAEGAEEGTSNLINTFADVLISKDKSQWAQSIQAYRDDGYDEKTAFWKAVGDQAVSLGLDMLGGALSGGVMGGTGAVSNAKQAGRLGRQIGRQNYTAQEKQAIVEAGRQFAPETRAAYLADKLTARQEKGKQLKNYDLGRQYQANVAAINEKWSAPALPMDVQAQLIANWSREFGKKNASQQAAASPGPNVQEQIEANMRGESGIVGTREQRATAERLSRITGRKVELFSGDADENGIYDRQTKTIYINVNGKDPFVQNFSHELTHSVELADVYSDLSKLIMDRYASQGTDLEAMRQHKIGLYADHGKYLSMEQADKEIVADYVARCLLTDEGSIRELSTQAPHVGRRILNWIDRMLAKLGFEGAQERAFLTQARSMYANALEQTKGIHAAQTENAPGVQTQTQAQVQDTRLQQERQTDADMDFEGMDRKKYRQWLDRALAREDITEEYYDEEMDRLEAEEEERQYSFAGKEAKNADRSLLQQAVLMKDMSTDPETILRETGWYVGADGLWRFEIDDSKMELAEDISNYMRLGDLIRHSELFAAYPDMADVDVVVENLQPGVYAKYNRQFDSISINRSILGNPEAIKNALIHEIQHAIQNREGFTAGSTVESWERKIRNGYDSRRAGDIQKAREVERKLAQIRQEQPDFYNAMMELEAMTPDVPRGEVNWDTLEKIEEDPPQWQAFDTRRDAIQEQYGDMAVWDFFDLLHDRERLAKTGRTALELYYDTAGEVEARNAEYRRRMTAEERKKTPPRMGVKDAVLAESNKMSEDYIPGVVSKEEIESNIGIIARMEPVVEIRGDEFRMGQGRLLEDVDRFFAEIGRVVYNDRLGDINLRRRGVKNDLGHGMSDEKAASFAAIPEVLRYGKVAGFVINKGNKGYDSATVVAPITIAGDPYMMGIIVHRSNGENRFYVHDVFCIKEEATPLITGAPVKGESGGAASTISIVQNILRVKENMHRQLSIHDPGEEQEGSRVRDSLNYKAKDHLVRAERELLKKVGDALDADKFKDRTYLRKIVEGIADEYLENGAVSKERADQLFTEAYRQGLVVDTAFYEQYKEIKKYLQGTAVTLSQRDQGDIADYGVFKRNAFGILRIVKEGGLPVDTAYDELHSMAPELFPEKIAHPADQLVRMYEVGRSIGKSERNLREHTGMDEHTFLKWKRNEFDNAIADVAKTLRTVKRYADAKAQAEAEERDITPKTAEKAMEAYREMRRVRRNVDKVVARNLLTDRDNIQVGRLLKGELLPDMLDPETDNVDGILAVYEAKRDYEQYAAAIKAWKKKVKQGYRDLADEHLKTAGEWKDKKVGILYSRETMSRNIQDIVKDPEVAKRVNREYFEAVAVSQAKATRFKNEYRQRVRDLNISTKANKGDLVSEAHAVQLLGEAMDHIRTMEESRGRIKTRDGKTLAEWRSAVDKIWEESPSLDKAKIERTVKDFREIYDDLFRMMNEVRVRNGYEPVPYRSGYFPHFQPGDGDSLIARFGKALGIDTSVAALPTTINGLTHTFRPGIRWFGNAQERLGFNTAYDAVEGFDRYIEGVADVIYQTDNIQKLRALASQVRYRTSDEGIRRRVDEVMESDRLTEEEKTAQIKDIYEHGRFELANFASELDEYTNLLANKKSKLDRTMEAMMGRRAYTVMKNFESRVGANMIAGNLSSALTNFIPLTQAGAQLDRWTLLRGMWSTLQSYRQDDGLVAASDFLTNRRGSDPLVKTWSQKASAFLGKPMELVDGFVSDSIVRAAYFQNLKQGLSEAEAMHQADVFAAGVIADRSKGAMPTLFASTNPIFKAFTQFQLEVNNQFSEVFKDIPRANREKGLLVLAGVLFKYFAGAWLFNELYEYFIGRRPALDPIDMVNNYVGDLTGYELPNVLELGVGLITGDVPEFTTEKVGLGEASANLAMGALEELPFSSGLGLLGVEIDGGRVPVSSAIPDLNTLWQVATNKDWSKEKKIKELKDEAWKLAYVIPPFGGNQLSKTIKGLAAYLRGGSYNVNAEGEKILQYPVYKDEPGDAFWNLVRSTIMGKSALPEAQEWVDSGFDSLSAEQTAVYQGLLDVGVKDRDAYAMIRELEKVKKTDEETEAELKRKALRDSDLSADGKAVVYYGLLASDTDLELMDKLDAAGADMSVVAGVLMDIQDATDSNAKRDAIAKAALTDQEKQMLYSEKVFDSRDNDIAVFRAAGMDFDTFLDVNSAYSRIDKEASGAANKALEFAYWIDTQKYSEKQKEVILDSFKYTSQVPVDADRYGKMVDAGVGYDDAYDLAIDLAELEPEEGKPSVQNVQRWRVCVDFSDNQDIQMAALRATMDDTQYTKVEIAKNMGVAPTDYVKLKEVLPQFDTDGNGYYKRTEIKAAIDSMTGCTREQKAVLWQLTVDSDTKAGSNPYGQSVGQRVFDARAAAKAKEEPTTGGSFEDAITSQW